MLAFLLEVGVVIGCLGANFVLWYVLCWLGKRGTMPPPLLRQGEELCLWRRRCRLETVHSAVILSTLGVVLCAALPTEAYGTAGVTFFYLALVRPTVTVYAGYRLASYLTHHFADTQFRVGNG